jgi:hypothetical protein
MDHSLAGVLWAGSFATVLSAAFFWVARTYGATRFDLPVELGCLILADRHSPRTETLGFLILLVLGTGPVAMAYAFLFGTMGETTTLKGILLGVTHGVLALLFFAQVGTISACARRGEADEPGLLGIGWGRFTPLVFLMGHALYGGVFALALGGF